MSEQSIEAVEGEVVELDDSNSVVFAGKRFRMADKIGLMPIMKFAVLAKTGIDSAQEEAMVAMFNLLQQCIADEDWDQFEQHATASRADDEELMKVVQEVLTKLSERPTQRPSDTSDGSSETSPSSTDDSSSRVIHRLEEGGRPDLALLVTQTVESRAS